MPNPTPIGAARWKVLSPLMDELMELEGKTREARLVELAQGDAALALDLRGLLAAHEALQHGAFLEGSAPGSGEISAVGVSLAGRTIGALGMLTQPIAERAPLTEQQRRGQALVVAGDCMSCHLREGGAPLSGGRAMHTPFGVLYTANITPDPRTGIGARTADDFYRAMHDGIDAHGRNLYPAFPYP